MTRSEGGRRIQFLPTREKSEGMVASQAARVGTGQAMGT